MSQGQLSGLQKKTGVSGLGGVVRCHEIVSSRAAVIPVYVFQVGEMYRRLLFYVLRLADESNN